MNLVRLALMVLASCALVPSVWAQEEKMADVAIPPNVFLDVQTTDQYLAKDLLVGAKVQNDEGKIIGDIEDLILNDWNRVVGVIMGTGGFFGIAEKRVAVALSALDFSEKDGKTVVTLPGVSNDVLKAVPAYERKAPKKSLLERAMEKAKELTDKSAETAKDAYEKSKDKAAPALERAREAAGDAYEKAKEAAGKAYEKAKEATSPEEAPSE